LYAATLRDLAVKARRRGADVVMVAPFPRFREKPAHAKLCEREWFRPHVPEDCGVGDPHSLEEARAESRDILAMLERLAGDNPSLHLYDPMPPLCEGGLCRSTLPDGRRLFRDRDHVSALGANRLASDLRQFLQDQGLLEERT
jgi:hypothetical protein